MASSGANSRLNAVLLRNRAVTAALLVILVLLAWAWLLTGAGMGMPPAATLWPEAARHHTMPGMVMDSAAASWSAGQSILTFSMWWVMMAAMMLPSAAPMVLLFARAATYGTPDAPRPPAEAFLAGYLTVWGFFSLLATGLQWQFEQLNLLSGGAMASTSRWPAGIILLLAGLYQLTPLKDACLRQCQNPARFLSRHYRPGSGGAFLMGVRHGAYCVGCCWLLMALLFVGGVMNLAWIALLTVLVALEKLLPGGRLLTVASGIALIAGAGAVWLG